MSTQTQIDRIKAAKTSIKASIEGKGITVPSGTKIDGMSGYIDAIDTSENLDEVLTEQESIIDAIQLALEGKAGGGISEDDITAELLQELDPDFKAENIAEGVNMFGLVGTRPDGAKVATGTVTASSYTLTVTGLDFTPAHIMTVVQNPSSAAYDFYGSYDNYARAYSPGAKTITVTKTTGGFTLKGGTSMALGTFSGTYYWVAWS